MRFTNVEENFNKQMLAGLISAGIFGGMMQVRFTKKNYSKIIFFLHFFLNCFLLEILAFLQFRLEKKLRVSYDS